MLRNSMNPYEETAKSWNKAAEVYQEKFMDLTNYDHTYDALVEALTPGATLLEIGCGPGNITRYLLRLRPDLDILATDLSPNMIALAQVNVPNARFQVLDSRNMSTLTGPFDAIVAGFCAPYISPEDVDQLFADSAKLLSEGGYLYFSYLDEHQGTSGYVTNSLGDRSYMFFHETQRITSSLQDKGFEVVHSYSIDFPRGQDVEKHSVLVGRKK